MACCHIAAIRGVVADQCKRPGQRTGDSVTKQLGVTLQGSACGARLFLPSVSRGTVAFARVLDLIREDEASKRAVMTMFGREELGVLGNTDVACSPSLVQMSHGRGYGVIEIHVSPAVTVSARCPVRHWLSRYAPA